MSISLIARAVPEVGSVHCQSTAIEIAGDPGLGPGQQPVLAEQAVDQRRLAGVGPPDDGQLQRPRGIGLLVAELVGLLVERLFVAD